LVDAYADSAARGSAPHRGAPGGLLRKEPPPPEEDKPIEEKPSFDASGTQPNLRDVAAHKHTERVPQKVSKGAHSMPHLQEVRQHEAGVGSNADGTPLRNLMRKTTLIEGLNVDLQHQRQQAVEGVSTIEMGESSQFGTAEEEQETLKRIEAQAYEDAPKHQSGKSGGNVGSADDVDFNSPFSAETLANAAALLQEEEQDPKKLQMEEDELYYKLFPEERPEAAASLLEQSKKKSFRIRVPISDGTKLCLTEDWADFSVRAEPCRKHEPRQKWYWSEESKIKNMHTLGRCLGVDRRQRVQSEDKFHHSVQGYALSMSFKCSLKHAPLAWVLTERGLLQSTSNGHCMAINEMEDFSAMVTPCELQSP